MLNSCSKKESFKSLTYKTGGFGVPNYHLIINEDKTFILNIDQNPLNEIIDLKKIGKFEGKISETEMFRIQTEIDKITRAGYDYNNPELILDAGNYELVINKINSIKVYQTNHATENFITDIINPLHEICEKHVKFKIE